MNELRPLLSLELRSLYGINKHLHTKNRKEQNTYRALSLVWVLLIGMVFAYVGGLVYGLCFLGLGKIVPAYLVMIASLLILAFGVFTAGNRIFGQKGYDILASMPVKPGSIVVSRFLSLYLEDLILTLVIMLPGVAVYGICQRPHMGFYLTTLAGTLFVPAIPLVAATLLGTLILAISARMKRKSMVQTLLMVLLVVGVLVGSFNAEGLANSATPEALSQIAQTISGLIGRIYPPAMWLGGAMVGTDLPGLGLFILISVGVMAFAMILTAKNFHAILRRLGNFTARHNYKIGKMESSGLLKALYLREVKRYFSSSIYVTNTIIGPIMGTILAVALWISGLNALQTAIPLDIPAVLPFVFSAVFCMMTTSSVSVSMEGKQFWIVKSLPIPTKQLLDSKILLNLSLMAPFYLVSVIAMAMATRPGPLELLWLVLIPASVILFSLVFGITVNLKFHSFDWEKEETVVKQSLSSMLGGFAGLLLAGILGVAAFLTPAQYGVTARLGICLLVLGVTALLYRKNNRAVLSKL